MDKSQTGEESKRMRGSVVQSHPTKIPVMFSTVFVFEGQTVKIMSFM